MSKITFGYIVGGADKHYNNLLRSLESLERIEQPYEVVVLDADSRLETDDDKPNVRIIPFPVDEAARVRDGSNHITGRCDII